MKRSTFILALLFVTTGVLYYEWSEPKKTYLEGTVTDVIDGDTLMINNETTIRLLGINTPEKGQPYYDEAKHSLEVLTLNKKVIIETQGTDKYDRTLGHVFINKEHVNEIIIKEGQATSYYYEKDEYYNKIIQAETYAQKQQLGLWHPSEEEHCIELIELTYKETTRCSGQEQIIIQNNCNKNIEVTIKDDANHIYKETLKANTLFKKNFSCTFNNEGDSLYIRDNKGLILFTRY